MPKTETVKRRRRSVFRFLPIVLVIVIGLLLGSAYRLTRGPVALPDWVVAEVETRAGRVLGEAELGLGGLVLAYDVTDHALRLDAVDAILSRDGAPLLRLPAMRVLLDGANLMRGRLRPRSLDFDGLALDVVRDATGGFNLALGSGAGGAFPTDPAEALAVLDRVLAAPLVAQLDAVRVSGITLRARDDITGLAQDVSGGSISLIRQQEDTQLTLALRLPVGRSQTARLAVTLLRDGRGGGARATLALVDVPLSYLAEVVPRVPALSLATGSLSATAAVTLDDAGMVGPVTGRVDLRDAQSVDRPILALDRATLGFSWAPGTGRVGLTQASASSDDLAAEAVGQVLLPEGITGPIQLQLTLGETTLDPEGMFDARVTFDSGLLEAQLTQAPLSLHIGQAMITGASGTARLTGQIAFPPDGLSGSVALEVPEMSVGKLKALWPSGVQLQARRWFFNNMIDGTARDVVGALRLRPGRPPEVAASFSYTGGTLRFMRHMPLAEGARGAAQFDGRRLAMRVDAATVPALGPGQQVAPDTPRLAIRSTTFVIADATQRPPRGTLSMNATGEIPDLLTLLNNRPLRLLDRIKRDRSFAEGTASARVEVSLPLRRGNAPADIDWSVEARLEDLRSDQIVQGRRLTAERVQLTADPEAVEVGGQLRLEGVPFNGSWRQALPPRGTEAIDPEAPPPPPVPLPEPGRVRGMASLTPEGLTRLGIDLSALDLSGQTEAEIDVTLPQGAAPTLSLRSQLRGLSIGLPAISWSKGRDTAAPLSLVARLGDVPEVTALSLGAPGLSAAGQITLQPGGGLSEARFDRVDTGWFRGPVTLTSRGAGRAPALAIRGGVADLRRALLRGGTGGRTGGEPSPLRIALDRLTVTEGISLTDLRARLTGGTGEFTAQINGGAAVEGVLVPQGGGTAVQIRGGDAGGVLRAADLFKDARGGAIQLTLRPTGQTGVYDGTLRIGDVRLRNAPALASLLQSLSVVGILNQLQGEGIAFSSVESDFTLRPRDIIVRRASAVGPSMSITADGAYDIGSKRLDLQGVISPIYLVNGLFGALFSRRDEGLFGFTYRLNGLASDPNVDVNPLSILTPGVFRDIFRRPPPGG